MPTQKVKKIKKVKKKTDKQLKKELDIVFSQFIRLSYADKNGYVKCSTCPAVINWKEIQNGHYESRQYLSLRFEEKNCHPQCVGCNIFRRGNYTVYALFMIEKYGQEHLNWLEIEKHKITKYFPYQEKIDYYKQKVADLLTRVL